MNDLFINIIKIINDNLDYDYKFIFSKTKVIQERTNISFDVTIIPRWENYKELIITRLRGIVYINFNKIHWTSIYTSNISGTLKVKDSIYKQRFSADNVVSTIDKVLLDIISKNNPDELERIKLLCQ